MGWAPEADDESGLNAAFAEADQALTAAFAAAVRPLGPPYRSMGSGKGPNCPVTRCVEWWVKLPGPGRYDSLSCEVNLLVTSDGPEVSGRIAAWRSLGRGVSDNDDLWRVDEIRVDSPAAAAAAVRRVAADVVHHLGRLDLGPYLAN